MFDDPRRGTERRAQWLGTTNRNHERRIAAIDRRTYTQEDASKPWWLMRGYVTAEKFYGSPRTS